VLRYLGGGIQPPEHPLIALPLPGQAAMALQLELLPVLAELAVWWGSACGGKARMLYRLSEMTTGGSLWGRLLQGPHAPRQTPVASSQCLLLMANQTLLAVSHKVGF
jgi:hypothetical protein